MEIPTMLRSLSFVLLASAFSLTPVSAQVVSVEGGITSVLLDFDTLDAAAGLTLNSPSPEVIAPGALGATSVAFPINPTLGPPLQTNFSYDPSDFLGTFAGTGIEHSGSITFDTDPDIGPITVGNFTIGFDGARSEGDLSDPLARSGFFVRSNGGSAATDGVILFDIGGPTELNPAAQRLDIGANLLVSNEFAMILQSTGLAVNNADLTGADVGDALVNAAIPEPTSAMLLALSVTVVALRRIR